MLIYNVYNRVLFSSIFQFNLTPPPLPPPWPKKYMAPVYVAERRGWGAGSTKKGREHPCS